MFSYEKLVRLMTADKPADVGIAQVHGGGLVCIFDWTLSGQAKVQSEANERAKYLAKPRPSYPARPPRRITTRFSPVAQEDEYID